MQVGSEPAPVYRLSVFNDFAEAMIVSYNDGRGDRLLGAIPAGSSETFVVAAPAAAAVTVSARSTSGSLTYGPTSIDLLLGSTVSLRLRP
jgi:hypothetical protein